MKEKLDISILEGEDFFKKGLSFVANNVGRVIAILTFVFACLVIFTDVTLCDFTLKSFGTLLLLMVIASYIIYFSMEDAGEKLGEECEEYKRARREYLEKLKLVGGEDISKLRKFCKKYSEDELEYRKDTILFSYGYTKEEYQAYENGNGASRHAKRVFRKVKRQRAVALNPSSLISKEKEKRKSELKSPESMKIPIMMLKLLPSTLCMAVTVSVVLSAKESLDFISVIEGLMKLLSLPIIGFRGYSHGYNHMKKSMSAWLDTKSSLITVFLKEKEYIS